MLAAFVVLTCLRFLATDFCSIWHLLKFLSALENTLLTAGRGTMIATWLVAHSSQRSDVRPDTVREGDDNILLNNPTAILPHAKAAKSRPRIRHGSRGGACSFTSCGCT